MPTTNYTYSDVWDIFSAGIRTAVGGAYMGSYSRQIDLVGSMGGSFTMLNSKASTIVHLEVNQEAVLQLDGPGNKEIHMKLESTSSGAQFTSYGYANGQRYEFENQPVGGVTSWSGNNLLMSWGCDVGFYEMDTRTAVYEGGVFDHWETTNFQIGIVAVPSYVAVGEKYPKAVPVQITDEVEIPWLLGTYTSPVSGGEVSNQYTNASYRYFSDFKIEEEESDRDDDTSTDSGGAWFTTVNQATPDITLPNLSILNTGMISLYKPTASQMTSIAQWLWSDAFYTSCIKNWSSPFENIIGLFQSKISPTAHGATFKVGNVSSGISVDRVTNQYLTLDCGTEYIKPYYNNFADYNGYREFKLYLPYYGMIDIDTDDIMGHSGGAINVKYHIDFLTGTGNIQVRTKRDGADGVWHTLYQAQCNIFATLPFSGREMLQYYASSLKNVVSFAGSAMSYNMTGMLDSGLSQLTNRPSYGGSKGMSGNVGLLSVDVPILFECLPLRAMPSNYSKYKGQPTEKYKQLSSCSGYTEVDYCRLQISSATDTEINKIYELLKKGVIL